MSKQTTYGQAKSSVEWEHLEEWVRGQVQGLIQDILEEEVTEFLGRRRSERRGMADGESGYRNGYGKPRKLTLSSGTITVKRPRVRNTDEQFESRVLPLFAKRTNKVRELIPQLYLHGLSEGDFDLALRGLLGDDAPVSASTVARLKGDWQAEYEQWRRRSLDHMEVVYVWADGVYVKAGLDKDKAALLVVMGALSDGSKVVLSVSSGFRESIESWSEVLRDLRERGMNSPRLVVADGNLGIWGALRNVYPEAAEQRCWNHRIINVLDRLPKKAQPEGKRLLQSMAYAESVEDAEANRDSFVRWCTERGYAVAGRTLARDWERMVTFFSFPREHWQHLRTTNPVESPFAFLRLRTDAARRFKKVDNATAVIWKLLLVGERRFRLLNAPRLMRSLYLGAEYVNGVKVRSESEEVAA